MREAATRVAPNLELERARGELDALRRELFETRHELVAARLSTNYLDRELAGRCVCSLPPSASPSTRPPHFRTLVDDHAALARASRAHSAGAHKSYTIWAGSFGRFPIVYGVRRLTI